MNNNYIALYYKGNYKIGVVTENRKFRKKDLRSVLPYVYKKDNCSKSMLDKIPNLAYIETKEGFKLYDVRFESYYSVTLPVYVIIGDELKVTKKKYTIQVPTQQMIEMARRLYSSIEHILGRAKYKEDIDKIEKEFSNFVSLKYLNSNDFNNLREAIKYTNKIIILKRDNDFIVGCPDNVISNNITLYVPSNFKRYVIGREAGNINKMKEILRVESIHIEEIK